MKRKPLSRDSLIADLRATYPGLMARKGGEFSKEFEDQVWTGGAGDMPDGFPVFCQFGGFEDGYDGGVHEGFTAWLENRGWYLENYDGENQLAYTIESAKSLRYMNCDVDARQ